MSGLLIKKLPDELHETIKEYARVNRRSLMQEALTLLEEAVETRKKRTPPPLIEGKVVFTREMVLDTIREGRE